MVTIAERGPEVYHFHPAVLVSAVVLAIFFQSALPVYFPFHELLALFELPLLVVVYFGFSRRNPSTGLLLGLAVGVLQDALSHSPIGLYGMPKTLVGYTASSLTGRLDTDPPHARLLLLFGFYYFHQLIFVGVRWLLLGEGAEFISLTVLEAALVNSLLGMLIFLVLDRFRRTT
ncbi:MAG: rod shape-determining protein MreD [Candidatus Acidiferrales bacterium]